jgi:hypothetical protein
MSANQPFESFGVFVSEDVPRDPPALVGSDQAGSQLRGPPVVDLDAGIHRGDLLLKGGGLPAGRVGRKGKGHVLGAVGNDRVPQ